jgi:hypothetical protein
LTEAVYLVETSVYATVTIRNPDVIERVTGPGGDEWRSQFYATIESDQDVVEHFAFNAITNGVHDITRLEGWGDCDRDDVLIEIDDTTHWTERAAKTKENA